MSKTKTKTAKRDEKTGKMKSERAEYKSGRKRPTLQLAIFSKQEAKWKKELPQMAREAGYESASHLAGELLDSWMAEQKAKAAKKPNGKAVTERAPL